MKHRTEWFQNIFKEFYSPLCNYALKITGKSDEAEDIVQSLFIDFWESGALEKVENIERYLLRSVKFKCIDYLRQRNKTSNVQLFNIQNTFSQNESDFSENEIEPLLSYYAAKLPPKTRRVFLLSRRSNKTYKQIAEELNISVKTVESQMGRALRKMKILLKESGFLSFFIHI